MNASTRISAAARDVLRAKITEASGDEVVFVCDTADGIIVEARAVARGTSDVAPAPISLLRRGRVVVHNHPGGDLRPSHADVLVAAELSEAGVGSYIVDNDILTLSVICEPAEGHELTALNAERLAGAIDADGRLSEISEAFEPRQAQMDMLRRVVTAFNEDTVLAVEAGTGVGKSFAYLIPALAWAEANEERVVISTATINLQQQLVDKDIPEVKRILGVDVDAVLVKGRGNYLCVKRLGEALDEATLFEDPDEDLAALREWSRVSATGGRDDVPFFPSDELWGRVNSDADSCSDLTCRLRDQCFFVRARRRAASARVLVVNHHLLFIDLALRIRGVGYDARAILPPFQRLVIDEAHSIENSATSLFSDSFSMFSILKHVRRLYRERNGRRAGLLPKARRFGSDAKMVQNAVRCAERVETAATALNAAATAVTEDPTLRLTPAMDGARRSAILDGIGELLARLIGLADVLSDLVEQAGESDESAPFRDVQVVLRRIERLAGLCRSFVEFEDRTDRVFWIEFRRSTAGRHARFVSTPLEIRQIMEDAVLDAFSTVVFTSATLTVARSFEFWASRVGLIDSMRDHELIAFASPYSFSENALLAVPVDAPEPSSDGYQPFLSSFVGDVLELTEGHALVLFTSYQMLRETYDAVRPRLTEFGIAALRQGEDDRARLLSRFNEDASSVLFATESFWQGVDAPGEALQVVVLCRLPFRVPTDPVLTARMELITAQGGNAFRELALPEAVMKLRQGFGRLIRRSSDRGVVVVTDIRFLTKPYGELFRASLPRTAQSFKSSAGVREDIERFLY